MTLLWLVIGLLGMYLLGRYHQLKADQKKVQDNLNKLL